MSRHDLRVFLFFAIATLVVSWKSLDYPMVYDDLHLIRAFSPAEIRASFSGNWDVDNVETPGLRPLSVIFNHARYALCGENVVAHRLLVVLLYALFFTLLTAIAVRTGLAERTAILGGLLCLCSIHSVFHYAWLTDAIHVLQGDLFGLAGVTLFEGVGRRRPALVMASLACTMAGLLVREDGLVVPPVLFLLAYCCLSRGTERVGRWLLWAWTVTAVAQCGGLLIYRRLVVPGITTPELHWSWFIRSLELVLHPMGTKSFDDVSTLVIGAWQLVLGGLLVGLTAIMIRRLRAKDHLPITWVWGGACLVALLPPSGVGRPNLYFFASAFASLFLVQAIMDIAEAWPKLRAAGMVALAIATGGGWYLSSEYVTNFHPWSEAALWMNGEFILGTHASTPIPALRRRVAEDRLASLGIRSPSAFRNKLPALGAAARAAGRRAPSGEGVVFVSRLPLHFRID